MTITQSSLLRPIVRKRVPASSGMQRRILQDCKRLPKPGEEGFTLLEVLVALAIAVPALVMLYRQGVVSMRATRAAAAYQEAISRAQSRLDALTNAGLVAGEQDGDDGGGFAWRTRIVPIASTAPPRPPPRASPYAGGTTLFAVAVEISWPGSEGTRTLVLDTRRLGPASAASP